MERFVSLISCVTFFVFLSGNLNAAEKTYAWGYPVKGNWWQIKNFEFGKYNDMFDNYHQAVDTNIHKTPYNTELFSPCSGVVKISDEKKFNGYGANKSTNVYYLGYVLVIECQEESGDYQTALLGHVQPGSSNYNAINHTGLAPLGAFVYKGQYVARINHYWNGSGQTDDWPHVHFGIHKGAFNPAKYGDYVKGYSKDGWNADHTANENWWSPTVYVKENSMKAVWHADGTLIQPYGQPDIFQVVDHEKHKITSEAVFNAHDFDWDQVLFISDSENQCIPSGSWQIDWAPCREVGVYDGRYYLKEKNCQKPTDCTVYKFTTVAALLSWNLTVAEAKSLTSSQMNDWFDNCANGKVLYLRDGAIVQTNFTVPGLVENGDRFVSQKNGALSKFSTSKAFWRSGYDYDDLLFFSADEEELFYFSYCGFGKTIIDDNLNTCAKIDLGGGQFEEEGCLVGSTVSTYSGEWSQKDVGECQAEISECINNQMVVIQEEKLPSTEVKDGLDNDCDGQTDEGFSVDEDKDDDGYTVAEGDCDDSNAYMQPYAEEICNNFDDDCDGQTDEGVMNACGKCGNVPMEVCDGVDNDCDGSIDEGVKNACGGCGAVGAEICDGIDNNCDGQTDEGLKNACGKCGVVPTEICDGIDNDCDGSIDEGVKNACGGCGAVGAEICDGIDNNCDGQTDEGLKNACGKCGVVPTEVCDGIDNDCDGSIDEGVKNACGGCGAVGAEICDGIDNNCDGQTDEGLKNACGKCGAVPVEVCDGVDNDCDGLIDEGVKNACGTCGAVPVEVCDGVDNDCDGVVDENCGVVSDDVTCTITCPDNMLAYLWWGGSTDHELGSLTVTMTKSEICLRGQPWIDYNCAVPGWSSFDPLLATISCNHQYTFGLGKIDFKGEGEIWFTDFYCFE